MAVPGPGSLALLERQFDFVGALSLAGRNQIATGATWHQVERRKMLLCRGDPISGVYLVLGGTIRVHYLHEDGREGTLYSVSAGDACFLSVSAVMSRTPYPAWAESDAQSTTFCSLAPDTFRALFDGEAALRAFTFAVLSRRVTEMMLLVEATASYGVEQRLAAWILREATLTGEVRTSQERIARHLGTAREVVVRQLRTFRSRGWLTTTRGLIQILDENALRVASAPPAR